MKSPDQEPAAIGSQDRRRVAVLGGTGFAGRNVRDALLAAGHDARAFSRATGCDLLDLASTWTALDRFRPEYVVNCAAVVGSVNFVSDFAADVLDVNLRMILNIYKVAEKLGDAVVVNPLANCAYPGIRDAYVEAELWDGPLHPSVLSYGSTRRMMAVCSTCYGSQYGVRSVNLLVPNMYGPYDSINPNKTHALNALVIKFVRALNANAAEIEIWGTGTPVREWLFVKDFARVVATVIARGDHDPTPVNIAQNHGHTVRELVEILSRLTGYAGRVAYNTGYQDGSPRKVMDNRQFLDRFPGFRLTPIEEGIRDTIAFYQRMLAK